MSASMKNRNDRSQDLLVLFIPVRVKEPVYVRPLRAPLKPMTTKQALKTFEEASK